MRLELRLAESLRILNENNLMKPGNAKQALMWNMSGVCFFYFCRWLITIAVVRMSMDFYSAGILMLAISITNIWNVVAMYAGRNIQVSDIKNEFTDSEYVSLRIITVLAAILFCTVHVLISSDNIYQSLVIIVYMIVIASTAFSDVLYGLMQKEWRMDVIGMSNVLRGILFLTSFIVFFYFYGLLASVIAMSFFSIAIMVLFDMPIARRYAKLKLMFDFKRLSKLIRICFPLVIVAFLFTFIPSFTRIMLREQLSTEVLGMYGSVTLPAAMAQTIVFSAFAPVTTLIARSYLERNYKKYLRIFWTGIVGTATVFLVFFVLSFPLGRWFLQLIFSAEAAQYAPIFSEAILFSMFMCLGWYIMIPLVVFRKTVIQAIIYACGALICLLFASFMIQRFGASGANYIQMIANGFTFVALFIAVTIISKEQFASCTTSDSDSE